MYRLTAYHTNDLGKRVFTDFDGSTKTSALRKADQHYKGKRWEIYTIKQHVRLCATSTDVATIYKNCVL